MCCWSSGAQRATSHLPLRPRRQRTSEDAAPLGAAAARARKRAAKRERRREVRRRRREHYERGCAWGRPAAAVAYGMAREMHMETNYMLWCAARGGGKIRAARARAPPNASSRLAQQSFNAMMCCKRTRAWSGEVFSTRRRYCARKGGRRFQRAPAPPGGRDARGRAQARRAGHDRPAGAPALHARAVRAARGGGGAAGAGPNRNPSPFNRQE
jgi:hypothetical protein